MRVTRQLGYLRGYRRVFYFRSDSLMTLHSQTTSMPSVKRAQAAALRRARAGAASSASQQHREPLLHLSFKRSRATIRD
jgi:hypothetical protein